MVYDFEPVSLLLFVLFVLFVLGMSWHFARKAKSAEGYFAAGGTIHWGVNGIAFAGDYLSAASFLGICGMIAVAGYDGFLYSIGYLAGWVVALFVVAEPMKRLGKYTFTDALDARFNSKGIQLMAAISTLVVSMCYLIPQMVGAGALVTPLLGLPHFAGVIMVGGIVITIVATAGMTSTTYVQFLKGALLIIFSSILCVSIFVAGIRKVPITKNGYHEFRELSATMVDDTVTIQEPGYEVIGKESDHLVKLEKDGIKTWWELKKNKNGELVLEEVLSKTDQADGKTLYNGMPKEERRFYQIGHMSKIMVNGEEVDKTGPVGPFEFLKIIRESVVVRFKKHAFKDGDNHVTVWTQNPTEGRLIMRPGLKFKVDPIKKEDGTIDKKKTFWQKLNFVSLMLALFFGTSALPHILIRYYTVPSQKDARKSTIVAIGSIGFFYILTMFMGLGAMVSGVINVNSSNMAAPLLAQTFGVFLFSMISAIAFATVLGTVSGLIVAASGAIAHDIMDNYMALKMTEDGKVRAGKIAAVASGIVAILLGIIFKGVNVSFLVGWAFAVAASANLPAILMLLFWKKTTAKGITASVLVGMVSALAIILVSPQMMERYNTWFNQEYVALSSLDNPGIISIPLSFITLVVVSLMTQKDNANKLADPE